MSPDPAIQPLLLFAKHRQWLPDRASGASGQQTGHMSQVEERLHHSPVHPRQRVFPGSLGMGAELRGSRHGQGELGGWARHTWSRQASAGRLHAHAHTVHGLEARRGGRLPSMSVAIGRACFIKH